MPRLARRMPVLLLLVGVLSAALPGCAASPGAAPLHLMPMDDLPQDVRSAPSTVRTAYQFAAANPDLMQAIPCYCGCGGIGHTSNYDCYVAGLDSGGALIFDGHALGCSICVDITLDAMRLSKAGKPAAEIRAYVDATYARYGPSNMD